MPLPYCFVDLPHCGRSVRENGSFGSLRSLRMTAFSEGEITGAG